MGVWLALEAQKKFAAKIERFAFLKFVGLSIPHANALQGGIDIQIEDDEYVGLWCKLLVLLTDFPGVKPTRTLISHG